MLPTSQKYLTQAGFAPQPAAYLLIGLFLLGVVGIQVISGFIHHYMPSHVVDCAHTHEVDGKDLENGHRDVEDQDSVTKVPENGNSENTPCSGVNLRPDLLQAVQHFPRR